MARSGASGRGVLRSFRPRRGGPRPGGFSKVPAKKGAGRRSGVFPHFGPKMRERRAGPVSSEQVENRRRENPPLRGWKGGFRRMRAGRASTEPARSIVTRRAGSMPMATMAAHAWRLFRADYGAWGVVLPRAVERPDRTIPRAGAS